MNNKKTIWSTVVSILSSVLAFLGIVSCCGMPLLAGVLAALGIGASQLAFFAEYRGWFIGLAIVSLLFGFYQSYFRTCNCCGNDSEEAKRKKARSIAIQRVFLWAGAIVVTALLFAGNGKQTNTSTSCCPVGQEETIMQTDCCGNSDTNSQYGRDTMEQTSCCPMQEVKDKPATGNTGQSKAKQSAPRQKTVTPPVEKKEEKEQSSCCGAPQEPTCCPAETDETVSQNGGCCGE